MIDRKVLDAQVSDIGGYPAGVSPPRPFLCHSVAWRKRPRSQPLTALPAGFGLPTAGEQPALMAHTSELPNKVKGG